LGSGKLDAPLPPAERESVKLNSSKKHREQELRKKNRGGKNWKGEKRDTIKLDGVHL